MHGQSIPLRVPSRERGRIGPKQARIAQRPDILDQRRETVEHPFGTIKQWMNQGAFLMRGLEKVRGEFSLTALAYNLRRVLNIVEFSKLIAALPAKSQA
jgi:transposase